MSSADTNDLGRISRDFFDDFGGVIEGPPVADYAPLVPRYKQLRQAGLALNKKLVASFSQADLREGAAKLDMLRDNIFVFDMEDETAVLMDYCIHDVWDKGMNVARRYMADSPPPDDSDEMKVLRAKLDARHSIFLVEHAERGVGIQVLDVLYRIRLPVMDVNFGNTAVPGLPLAMRVMKVEGIWMSTGAAIPAEPGVMTLISARLRKMLPPNGSLEGLSPQRLSDVSAMIIDACLKAGGMSHMEHADPSAAVAPSRRAELARGGAVDRRLLAAPKVGRNAPCPCGSGRKFKKCCGLGRS